MKFKIIIFNHLEDLHTFCAEQFINVIKENPRAKIGFATGVSPIPAYQKLVIDFQKNNRDWSQITTFNLDEFVGINSNHPEAFIVQMHNNLFKYLNLKQKNIHIPHIDVKNPHQEAKNYENLIRKIGPIDFQYLSLGINGHIAYNEPGTSLTSLTHVATLTPETIKDMVAKKKFKSIDDSPQQAITMGVATILKYTKKVMMVAFGKHKADMTKKMLEDKPNREVTATALQKHPNCFYVLDKGAARKLSPDTLKNAQWR